MTAPHQETISLSIPLTEESMEDGGLGASPPDFLSYVAESAIKAVVSASHSTNRPMEIVGHVDVTFKGDFNTGNRRVVATVDVRHERRMGSAAA